MSSMQLKLAASAGLMVVFAAVAVPAGSAFADHHEPGKGHDHGQHKMDEAAPQQKLSEASKAYEEAMQKMHKEMTVPYTNDVDVDFVRGMIPHHQGAIDQAEVLLKFSKNPRLRRLAGGIIAAQRREIRFMQKWLKEHDQGVETGEMPEWMKNAPSTAEEAKSASPDEDKP